jgi:integrase
VGHIYRRGKNWYIDLYVKGRRVRKKIGPSKSVAQLALKDAEVKAARDEFGFTKNDITIEKFLQKFDDYSRTNHSPATRLRYSIVIDHFKRFLSRHPTKTFLSQINPRMLDEYKTFRKDEQVNPNGEPVTSKKKATENTRNGARAHTINFELRVLKLMFNLAKKWGYLKRNPVEEVTRLKVNDAKPPRFLATEECQRLLEHSPDHLYPIFFTFLNTGMRKAELENLEWADVDLERRKIRIQRKDFWRPKTGERDIPINQKLLELLTRLKDENDSGLNSSFVFPHKDGAQTKAKLRLQLIKIAERAGIENLTKLHSLRHTFASHLVMKGVDLPTVQKLMGHSDIKTTMIYAHLAPDHLVGAVEKLEF